MQTAADIISHLELEGYCIIKEVIPSAAVAGVRDSVLAAFETQAAAALAHADKVRSQGHRQGGAGVTAVTGLLNLDQSVAPYLADERIIGAAEGLFGPYVRITNVSAMVNFPNNDRGYWHADWPYNQTNASHIPAPYADQAIKLSSIWMLTEFSPKTGGTLVIPGSQKMRTNPSGGDCHDREAPHAAEVQISGAAGSVILLRQQVVALGDNKSQRRAAYRSQRGVCTMVAEPAANQRRLGRLRTHGCRNGRQTEHQPTPRQSRV